MEGRVTVRKMALSVVVVTALSVAGCSGDNGKQIYETAQFEEKQNNREHAQKLYEDVIAQYSDGDFAKQARDRLAALKEKR